MQLGAGTTLLKGKYLLNHVLDQQGIGWTYRATQTQINQSVVIKTLNPVFRSHPEYRRMCEDFETRSQQWARIRHPGLVQVLDFFYEGTRPQTMPFVVMEAVVGTSLGDRLRSETISEADIILFLKQMASALTQTQDQGLVHGNLRPRNIIRRSGSQGSGSQGSGSQGSGLQNYVIVGSAASLMPSLFERSALQNPYAAPELSQGKLTSSADLYSLGAILYTCLSGHSPTLAAPDAELSDRLPLLSLLKPGAIRLLRAAMASAPSDRPETANDWLALLASRSTTASKSIALPTVNLPVNPAIPTPSVLPATIATPEPFPPYRTEALPTKSTPAIAAPIVSRIAPPMASPPTPIATPIAAPIPVPTTLPAFQTSPNPTQPPATPIHPIQRVESRPTPHPAKHSPFTIHHSPFRSILPPMRSIKRTAGIAAIGGILFGLVLRFHAAQRPGASLFHTGQSFPTRDWKGTIDPPNDNLDNIPIEAPGSRPTSSRSAEPNPAPALEKPSETPSERLPDNPVNPEPLPSIDPYRNRRTAAPSEFPQDSGSGNSSVPEKPDRSIVPNFPLQRDPESVTTPSTGSETVPSTVPAPIPDSSPEPESPPASRSTPRSSSKKGL